MSATIPTTSQPRALASLHESLSSSPKKQKIWASLSPDERAALEFHWPFWARPSQLPPPGDWTTWLVLAGRGFGKTRAGAQWIIAEAYCRPTSRAALVGRTAADVRDVMIDGESGILACSPPWFQPRHLASQRLLRWPNGAQASTYSAEEPNQLRGPQHTHAWADELAAWEYPDAWTQLQMGLRLGRKPRSMVTTTPRPVALIRDLIATGLPNVHVTRGSTFDNRSNLPKSFFDQVISKYEGTRLGRQELYAEILDESEGALWSHDLIERYRVRIEDAPKQFRRIVVAIDPAVTDPKAARAEAHHAPDKRSYDETGIVVVGLADDGHAYVLEDASGHMGPADWAKRAAQAYDDHRADRVIAEINNGGALVEVNLRAVNPELPYRGVHASQGKRTRAEPVAALYEQGRVHHVGVLGRLEDQMCTWEPLTGQRSPDRMDALVWGVTELALGESRAMELHDGGEYGWG